MNRSDALQRCYELALKVAHTGIGGENSRELEDLARMYDIFVIYTDAGIVVEDRMARYTFR